MSIQHIPGIHGFRVSQNKGSPVVTMTICFNTKSDGHPWRLLYWLVVWNIFFHILWIIIPTEYIMFFSGLKLPIRYDLGVAVFFRKPPCGLVMTMDGMLSSTIRNRKGHESTKRKCARGVKTSLKHLEDTVGDCWWEWRSYWGNKRRTIE